MERTSSSRTALGPDETLVEFDQVLANRQPEAETTRLAGQTDVYTMEAIKDALQMLRRNAYSMIAHTNFQHVPRYLG